MRESDLGSLAPIMKESYPDLPDETEAFRERLALFPAGCRVLRSGDGVLGYAISHPWVFGSAPKLNARLGQIPRKPDVFYIHDVAISSLARGRGGARQLLSDLAELGAALGVERIALVAIAQAVSYWAARGFEPVSAAQTAHMDLSAYGEGACYMALTPATSGR